MSDDADKAKQQTAPKLSAAGRFWKMALISLVAVQLLLLGAFQTYQYMVSLKPEVQESDPVVPLLNVDVFAVQPLDIREIISGFGTVVADQEVIVASQVAGEVQSIHPALKVGTQVSMGTGDESGDPDGVKADADLLLKIDRRPLQQQLEQATNTKAESESAIAQLNIQQASVDRQLDQARKLRATLKAEYDRAVRGSERGTLSDAELNRSLLELQRYDDNVAQLESQAAAIPPQIASAKLRLASSKVAEQRATDDLAKADVFPPFDGVLSEVFVDKGQYVTPGTPLVRLMDLNQVEVPISLGSDDFTEVQRLLAEGQRPRVELRENESAGMTWEGTVVRAAPRADSDSRTVQVFVEVSNRNNPIPLLPGTFVLARITGAVSKSTTLVPRESVINGAVFVIGKDQSVERRAIKSGRTFQSFMEVLEGLNPGETIMTTNLDRVEDDTKVAVQNRRNPLSDLAAIRQPVIAVVE